jgi:hypothetical protein
VRAVVHIDGLGHEPLGPTYIPAGTSLHGLVQRFGGIVRLEHLPDLPGSSRELSDEAREFLRGWEYKGSALAVFWRHHSLEAEEFDTVEDAERFIEGGEEYGSLAGEAVVTPDGTISACD